MGDKIKPKMPLGAGKIIQSSPAPAKQARARQTGYSLPQRTMVLAEKPAGIAAAGSSNYGKSKALQGGPATQAIYQSIAHSSLTQSHKGVLNNLVESKRALFDHRGARLEPANISTGNAEWDRAMMEQTEKYNLPPGLLSSIALVESAFDPGAISEKGAAGLMQIMPGTAKRLGLEVGEDPDRNLSVDERIDPIKSIGAAADLLSRCYKKYKKYDNAVALTAAAYNAGEPAIDNAGGKGVAGIPNNARNKETPDYARKIEALMKFYNSAPAAKEEK